MKQIRRFKQLCLHRLDKGCATWRKSSWEGASCHFIENLGVSEGRELWSTLWVNTKKEACFTVIFFSFLLTMISVDYVMMVEHIYKREPESKEHLWPKRTFPNFLCYPRRWSRNVNRGFIFPINKVALQ